MIRNTSGPAAVFSGTVNIFACATKLAGPETDIVTPNNDTLCSLAQLQLAQGFGLPCFGSSQGQATRSNT